MSYSGKCRNCDAYIQFNANRKAMTFTVSKLTDPLHATATRDQQINLKVSEKIRTECPYCGFLAYTSRQTV